MQNQDIKPTDVKSGEDSKNKISNGNNKITGIDSKKTVRNNVRNSEVKRNALLESLLDSSKHI